MARQTPLLTLAVSKPKGFTAFGTSAVLHGLALGSVFAGAFGASGTLPDPAGLVCVIGMPPPEMVAPAPPAAPLPVGLQRLASVRQATLVDPTLTVPPKTPDGLPEPEAPDFLGNIGSGTGPGVEGGDPNATGSGSIVGGLDRVSAAAAVAPPPRPTRVSEGVQGPRRVNYVAPAYPQIAIVTHIEGKVVLDCLITEEGRIAEVTVLEGNPLLAPAAVEAVQQWRYTPTLVSGVRSAVIMKVTVNFTLSR